jgi:cytokinesis protein
LNSPRIGTRKQLLDMLVYFVYMPDEGPQLVLGGLEALSKANDEGSSPFAYWFKSLDHTLAGRGRMGSLVGASEEVRRNAAGQEGSLNDYAVGLA